MIELFIYLACFPQLKVTIGKVTMSISKKEFTIYNPVSEEKKRGLKLLVSAYYGGGLFLGVQIRGPSPISVLWRLVCQPVVAVKDKLFLNFKKLMCAFNYPSDVKAPINERDPLNNMSRDQMDHMR